MIKRIIFDIDNTLLDTNKDCLDAYTDYFKDNIKAKDLYELLEIYESNNGNYNKVDLENYLKSNFDKDFDLAKMLDNYGSYGTLLNSNVKIILEYLSKKYELVALTNWYVEPQKKRLEKAKILKYFKHIYGFEDGCFKPDKKTFFKACDGYKVSDCLMVGDSIKNDIEVPYELGINVIYIGDTLKYPHISNIIELSDIL